MDMLCIMFEAPVRGTLTVSKSMNLKKQIPLFGKQNGKQKVKQIESKNLAILVGARQVDIEHLLAELEGNDVYSTLANGTIYNRRMYRDWELSQKRAEAGKQGGHGKTGKQNESKVQANDKANAKQASRARARSSSSSTSSSPSTSSPASTATAKKKKSLFVESSNELRLAELLRALIKKNNPNANTPENLQAWAKVIDLMIRIDNRTPDQIEEVLRWSQADTFWWKNIRSTGKLRKQFDELTVRMMKKPNRKPIETPESKKLKEKWKVARVEYRRLQAKHRDLMERRAGGDIVRAAWDKTGAAEKVCESIETKIRRLEAGP